MNKLFPIVLALKHFFGIICVLWIIWTAISIFSLFMSIGMDIDSDFFKTILLSNLYMISSLPVAIGTFVIMLWFSAMWGGVYYLRNDVFKIKDKTYAKDNNIQKICTIIGGISFVLFLIALLVAPDSGKFYSEGFTVTMSGLDPAKFINWTTVVPLIITIGCSMGFYSYREEEKPNNE